MPDHSANTNVIFPILCILTLDRFFTYTKLIPYFKWNYLVARDVNGVRPILVVIEGAKNLSRVCYQAQFHSPIMRVDAVCLIAIYLPKDDKQYMLCGIPGSCWVAFHYCEDNIPHPDISRKPPELLTNRDFHCRHHEWELQFPCSEF